MNTKKHPTPLKWAGGKARMMTTLCNLIPNGKRLIEPFVGGGSVFMSLSHPELVLNDANASLMNFYRCVRDKPSELLEASRALFREANRNPESFSQIKRQFNLDRKILPADEKWTGMVCHAAHFLYLNKFGFNGLYRTNNSGDFNVGFGAKERLPTLPEYEIKAMCDRLKTAILLNNDFEELCMLAGKGDVLYMDPPYVPTEHNTTSFSQYQANGFTMNDQKRVATMARIAASRGAVAIVSNHDTTLTRELYKDAHIVGLSVQRSISRSGDTRRDASELIAVFNPHTTPVSIDRSCSKAVVLRS